MHVVQVTRGILGPTWLLQGWRGIVMLAYVKRSPTYGTLVGKLCSKANKYRGLRQIYKQL